MSDQIDFHHVLPEHERVHDRLINWAMTVRDHSGPSWTISRIWRMGKSNARQWHPPKHRRTVDILDGWRLEKLIASLPFVEKSAIRWVYVYQTHPGKAARIIGVSRQGLFNAIHRGRQLIQNLLTS